MTPTQAYEAAMEEFGAECKRFYVVRDAYRARRIGDTEFLNAKAALDAVQAKVDAALSVLENTPL